MLVGSVTFNGYPHAMVLDTINHTKLVFKNTNSENKRFEIEADHDDAPEEFFFVHIEVDEAVLHQIRTRLQVR